MNKTDRGPAHTAVGLVVLVLVIVFLLARCAGVPQTVTERVQADCDEIGCVWTRTGCVCPPFVRGTP